MFLKDTVIIHLQHSDLSLTRMLKREIEREEKSKTGQRVGKKTVRIRERSFWQTETSGAHLFHVFGGTVERRDEPKAFPPT